MPATELRVTANADELLERFRDELQPTLQAAATLAQEADDLLRWNPGNVNPIVMPLQRLAPLQAAVDAFLDAAGELVETHVPAPPA